jgi:hypothetical protein
MPLARANASHKVLAFAKESFLLVSALTCTLIAKSLVVNIDYGQTVSDESICDESIYDKLIGECLGSRFFLLDKLLNKPLS